MAKNTTINLKITFPWALHFTHWWMDWSTSRPMLCCDSAEIQCPSGRNGLKQCRPRIRVDCTYWYLLESMDLGNIPNFQDIHPVKKKKTLDRDERYGTTCWKVPSGFSYQKLLPVSPRFVIYHITYNSNCLSLMPLDLAIRKFKLPLFYGHWSNQPGASLNCSPVLESRECILLSCSRLHCRSPFSKATNQQRFSLSLSLFFLARGGWSLCDRNRNSHRL